MLPRATRVITGTNVGKQEIIDCYGVAPENISVIPFPAPSFAPEDLAPLDIRKIFDLHKDYLFYPAQFWPHKNHVNILHCLKKLKEEHKIVLDFCNANPK